jgi:hypothetical protein
MMTHAFKSHSGRPAQQQATAAIAGHNMTTRKGSVNLAVFKSGEFDLDRVYNLSRQIPFFRLADQPYFKGLKGICHLLLMQYAD